MVFTQGICGQSPRLAGAGDRRPDRRAVSTSAISVHLGADVWARPRVLHGDGSSRRRVDESAVSGNSFWRNRVGGSQRGRGRDTEHWNSRAALRRITASAKSQLVRVRIRAEDFHEVGVFAKVFYRL